MGSCMEVTIVGHSMLVDALLVNAGLGCKMGHARFVMFFPFLFAALFYSTIHEHSF